MNKPKELYRCEECHCVFEKDVRKEDGKWGHLCRARNYKEEHRCESYLQKYSLQGNGKG